MPFGLFWDVSQGILGGFYHRRILPVRHVWRTDIGYGNSLRAVFLVDWFVFWRNFSEGEIALIYVDHGWRWVYFQLFILNSALLEILWICVFFFFWKVKFNRLSGGWLSPFGDLPILFRWDGSLTWLNAFLWRLWFQSSSLREFS